MLKQLITYKNFDDEKVEKVLYFNVSKTELAENNVDLEAELQGILERIEQISKGEEEATTADMRRLLELVKTLMRMAYGIRSEDGERFIKSPELWTEFTQTAAYDAFLMSLFENEERAVAFMLGIMPAELREEGKAAADLAIKRSSAAASIREKADEYNKRQESTPVVAATEVQAPIVPTNADIEAYLASQKGNVTQGSHLL